MRRYLLYLSVAGLAFGIGALLAYKFYPASVGTIKAEKPQYETPIFVKKPFIKPNDNNLSPDDSINLETIFTDKESISSQDFTVSKQYLKRKFANGEPVDAPFAVIKKGGKKLFEIDKNLEDYSREIRFGLFPFLGDENNKQLIIETTANRYWHYTIVNLSPKLEVVFDSDDYPLMGELQITDLDKDGKYELNQELSTFFDFGVNYRMGYAATPIIFKYDSDKQKYAFANHQFEDHLLKASDKEFSIEEKLTKLRELKADKPGNAKYASDIYSAVMDIFLTYLYLGREKEAWNCFEEYDLSDKETVRAEIKKYLAEDTLYQHIKTLKL